MSDIENGEDQSDDNQLSSPERPILFLSGDICRDHLNICAALLNLHYSDTFNEPIHLVINSNGGDCSIGWSIVDMMNFIRLPVYTTAVGVVASMAADIFVNGDYRTIGEHSTIMIHPHSGVRLGNHSQLIAQAKSDEIEHNRRLAHYANNSKYKTVKGVEENLFTTRGDDLWLTPEEMLSHGLCDEIARTDKLKRRKSFGFLPKGSGQIVKHLRKSKAKTRARSS